MDAHSYWDLADVRDRYNNSILASLDTIGEKCLKTVRTSRPEATRQAVRQYLGHIETVRNIAAWADPTDSEEEDLLLGSGGIELQRLLKLAEDLDTVESRKRWEGVQWKMEEPSDMSSVFRGSEVRIEQARPMKYHPVPGSCQRPEIPFRHASSTGKSSGANNECNDSQR